MRPVIGEFIGEKAASFKGGRDLNEQLMIDGFLVLLESEIDRSVAELIAISTKADKRGLRQFEAVVLRHEDRQQWRNFLRGVKKRKNIDGLLERFLEWLTPETESPANHCLEEAASNFREIHYGETAGGILRNRSPAVDKESWGPLENDLKNWLRPVVLRELILRTVGRALYEQ